jgi:hypothetical protein
MAVALCLFVVPTSPALVLEFSNLNNTVVDFTGGGFSFTSTNGYQFKVTGITDGAGDSVGFQGYVTGSPFMIGTIVSSSGIESAPVTGTGTLHITDAASTDLTGTIEWLDIATVGVGGAININGMLNLTGISYLGTSSDLNTLASAGSASDVVTFQFNPAKTLTELKNTGGSTSYSGNIYAVPEPGTIMLVAVGLLGLFLPGFPRS